MLSYRSDLCSMQCFNEACPTACSSCIQCYTCDHIQHLGLFRNITTCLNGEKCYVLASMSTMTGEHSYRVGCMHQNACSQLMHVFLRHLVNAAILLSSTSVVPVVWGRFVMTTYLQIRPLQALHLRQSQCDRPQYQHTFRARRLCFLYKPHPNQEPVKIHWLYCAHHCSLISEDFSSVIRQVIRFSREQLHDQSTSVYIGVQDKNQDGHFTWISSGSPAFPPQTPRQGKYCATLNIDSMRPTAVTCTEMYYVLCEAFYRS
ncbi:uncharacterized protein LOC130053263 isoform X1 [Ostrea edulis]|uniref:uncharacterized protein LOC130053263 isoform X1 n=1 Tax=Ostrea edulis TaxID=37623 RepID=UPI0024AFF91F|nr:uncharacterized protein LOC130053263 isoform X1 [Ostrea edulis]